jgi:hypothetical protein
MHFGAFQRRHPDEHRADRKVFSQAISGNPPDGYELIATWSKLQRQIGIVALIKLQMIADWVLSDIPR